MLTGRGPNVPPERAGRNDIWNSLARERQLIYWARTRVDVLLRAGGVGQFSLSSTKNVPSLFSEAFWGSRWRYSDCSKNSERKSTHGDLNLGSSHYTLAGNKIRYQGSQKKIRYQGYSNVFSVIIPKQFWKFCWKLKRFIIIHHQYIMSDHLQKRKIMLGLWSPAAAFITTACDFGKHTTAKWFPRRVTMCLSAAICFNEIASR
jgi:hypothetical protein